MLVRNIKVVPSKGAEYELAVARDNGDILLIKSGGHGGAVLRPWNASDLREALGSVLALHAPDAWTIEIKVEGDMPGAGFDVSQNFHLKEWAERVAVLREVSLKADGLEPSDCPEWNGINTLWTSSLQMAQGYFEGMWKLHRQEKIERERADVATK